MTPEKDSLELSRKSQTTLIAFLICLFAMMYLAFKLVRPYILAVVMGGILAILARPLYLKLRKRSIKEKFAASMVVMVILFLVIGPIAGFTTQAVRQGISVGQTLSDNEDISFHTIVTKVAGWEPIQQFVGDSASFEKQIRSSLQSFGKSATAAILALAANVPQLLLQLVLALIACFFLLIDGPKLTEWASDKIPLDRDVRKKIGESFRNTAVSVILATLAAAGAQGALMFVAFLVLGVPAAFLAAGSTFVFAWIPMIGSVPVWIIGAVYLYMKGSLVKAIIMVAFGLVTSVIDNFIRPLVLKGRGEMHPLVSLVAIFGGIEMFGIVGVFLGPIIAAVTISFLQIWPSVGEKFGLLLRSR